MSSILTTPGEADENPGMMFSANLARRYDFRDSCFSKGLIGPSWVKGGKVRTEQMFFGLRPIRVVYRPFMPSDGLKNVSKTCSNE